MSKKNFFAVSGTVFLLIALVHLFRILQDWQVIIGDYTLPVWMSWAAVIAGLYLSYQGLKHRRN